MITIDGTPQEIFDKVVEHLAQQKVRAGWYEDGEFACKYRDSYGNKCAIGCLIPDELYTNTIEGDPIYRLINNKEILYKGNVRFLQALQSAHDQSDNAKNLIYNLSNIANDYELNTDKIQLITEWS